jgi:hypothetical protein
MLRQFPLPCCLWCRLYRRSKISSMLAECFNEKGYLLVLAPPPWTTENAKQVIEETKTEAIQRGYTRILFDLTKWSSPEFEIVRFFTGAHLAAVLEPPFRSAAFALPEFINKFGENTAVNRGAWFRIFPDKISAISWLMKKPHEDSGGR